MHVHVNQFRQKTSGMRYTICHIFNDGGHASGVNSDFTMTLRTVFNQSINQLCIHLLPQYPRQKPGSCSGAPAKSATTSRNPNYSPRKKNVNRQLGVQVLMEERPSQKDVPSGVAWKLLLKEPSGQKEGGAYSTECMVLAERKALAPVLVLTLGTERIISLCRLSERAGIDGVNVAFK